MIEVRKLPQALPSPSVPPTETLILDQDAVSVTWRIL